MNTNDADVLALERCPFCGNSDSFVERADLSSATVICNHCGARGPIACQESDDEETPGEASARKEWNTRALSRPVPEGWKRVALALMPKKPDPDAHDGPCCYRLMKLDSGKERWVGEGCHCQNYDDAQRAGDWANDMNRWLDAQEVLEREGLAAPSEREDR
jgi:Lar family restriction alleviation protein